MDGHDLNAGSTLHLHEHSRTTLEEGAAPPIEAIIDALPVPIYYKDADGICQCCNRAFEELVREPKGEILGRSTCGIAPREVAYKHDNIDSELLANQGMHVSESSVIYPDGTTHDMVFHKATFTMEDGTLAGLVCFILDITEVKKTEVALKELQRQYKCLFDNAADPIYLQKVNGCFLDVNTLACSRMDYTRKELLKKDLQTITSPEHEGALAEKIEKLKLEGSLLFETEHITKDGVHIPTELSARMVVHNHKPLILAIARDITDRKRTQEALAAQKEFSSALLDSMHEGIIMVDKSKRLAYVNPAFYSITGFTYAELVGTEPPFPFWAEDDISRNMMILEEMCSGGHKPGEEIEVSYQRKDGEPFYGVITPTPVKTPDGMTGGWMAVVRDITEQKKAEEDVRRRLMKFRIEEGNVYLVKECTPIKSLEAFNEMLSAGYNGLLVTRNANSNLSKEVSGEFDTLWLSEKKGENTISPNLKRLEGVIDGLSGKWAVLIDRMDYLIFKNETKNTISFVQRIRDTAYLKRLTVLLCLDPSTLSERDIRLFEKETLELEPMLGSDLPEPLLGIIRYVYKQNAVGTKPTYSDISMALNISKPTVRKRVQSLVSSNYLKRLVEGRCKFVELTEKARVLF